MSYRTFFSFAAGLSKPVHCPAGTLASIMRHVEDVEKRLGLEREKYLENPVHWNHWKYRPAFLVMEKKILCKAVEEHNGWVRWLYDRLGEWYESPVKDGEVITPEQAVEFWHALEILHVPAQQWTREYYVARMEACYSVMRGNETEGVTFDERKLTPKQAGAVICLFSEFLDSHDMRLDVPNGHDCLASSYDGGYEWCEKCGPMRPDDVGDCKRRKCPLLAERRAEEEDE